MNIGLLEKTNYVQCRRQDLPLGPSNMFFRGQILMDTILLCGVGHVYLCLYILV
jgi:hypothetical protein